MAEVWEDGSAFEDLRQRCAALAEARERIEAARKVGETHFTPMLSHVLTGKPSVLLRATLIFHSHSTSSGVFSRQCINILRLLGRQPDALSPPMFLCAMYARGASLYLKFRRIFEGLAREVQCMQAMRKRLPPPGAPPPAATQDAYLAPEDYVAQDEVFKVCCPNRIWPHPLRSASYSVGSWTVSQ